MSERSRILAVTTGLAVITGLLGWHGISGWDGETGGHWWFFLGLDLLVFGVIASMFFGDAMTWLIAVVLHWCLWLWIVWRTFETHRPELPERSDASQHPPAQK